MPPTITPHQIFRPILRNAVRRTKTIAGNRDVHLNLKESAPFLSFKEVFVQAESHLATLTYTPMGSLSTLTINFGCLEHRLRWGPPPPPAPVALCSVACWDIFADWARLQHPWPVFTRLGLLKAYLRWKKGVKKKKMRGNTRGGGTKIWLPQWGWGGSKRPRLLRDLFVVIWSLSWLSLPLPLSAFLFLRFTGNRGMSVYKTSSSRFTRFPLPLWINMIICFFPNFLIEHTQCGRP